MINRFHFRRIFKIALIGYISLFSINHAFSQDFTGRHTYQLWNYWQGNLRTLGTDISSSEVLMLYRMNRSEQLWKVEPARDGYFYIAPASGDDDQVLTYDIETDIWVNCSKREGLSEQLWQIIPDRFDGYRILNKRFVESFSLDCDARKYGELVAMQPTNAAVGQVWFFDPVIKWGLVITSVRMIVKNGIVESDIQKRYSDIIKQELESEGVYLLDRDQFDSDIENDFEVLVEYVKGGNVFREKFKLGQLIKMDAL